MNRLAPALFAFIALPFAMAHPGGLDSKGGHNDRKNGGYHYHRKQPDAVAPKAITTAAASVKASSEPPVAPVYNTSAAKDGLNMGPAPSAASALAKITIGMTRAQVESLIGKPNISSENSWLYSAHGWVRFRGDTVFNIEAK